MRTTRKRNHKNSNQPLTKGIAKALAKRRKGGGLIITFQNNTPQKNSTNATKNIKEILNMKIFEKRKLILTEWDNTEESQENYFRAIRKLKEDNIPFKIVQKRMISEYAKKLYFTYSLILDFFLLLTIILAFLNADKLLAILQGG